MLYTLTGFSGKNNVTTLGMILQDRFEHLRMDIDNLSYEVLAYIAYCDLLSFSFLARKVNMKYVSGSVSVAGAYWVCPIWFEGGNNYEASKAEKL